MADTQGADRQRAHAHRKNVCVRCVTACVHPVHPESVAGAEARATCSQWPLGKGSGAYAAQVSKCHCMPTQQVVSSSHCRKMPSALSSQVGQLPLGGLWKPLWRGRSAQRVKEEGRQEREPRSQVQGRAGGQVYETSDTAFLRLPSAGIHTCHPESVTFPPHHLPSTLLALGSTVCAVWDTRRMTVTQALTGLQVPRR